VELAYDLQLPPWQPGLVAGARAGGRLAGRTRAPSFVYVDGFAFVARIGEMGGWERVNKLYENPPRSTEHILHPERYLANDQPILIERGEVPGLAAYNLVYEDSWGELNIRAFARKLGGHWREAKTAAEGWGGDWLALYALPGHVDGVDGVVAVHLTVWDERKDAEEYFDIVAAGLGRLAGGTSVRRRGAFAKSRAKNGAIFEVERRDKLVVLLAGAPAKRAKRIRREVWKTWRVRDAEGD
jgi:hypothetical protein